MPANLHVICHATGRAEVSARAIRIWLMRTHCPALSAYEIYSTQYDSRLNRLILDLLLKKVLEHKNLRLCSFDFVLPLVIVLHRFWFPRVSDHVKVRLNDIIIIKIRDIFTMSNPFRLQKPTVSWESSHFD